MSKENKIEAERYYTLTEIVELQLFPWCKNVRTYRKYIMADRRTNNFLKAIIIGNGVSRTYRIRGENIIKYLVNVEDGTITLNNE